MGGPGYGDSAIDFRGQYVLYQHGDTHYTTLPGAVPDEAEFTPTISATLAGGIIGTKQAFPNDNVRIGDSVTYTVRITVSPNVYLTTPIFTDTLPQGFHYRAAR